MSARSNKSSSISVAKCLGNGRAKEEGSHRRNASDFFSSSTHANTGFGPEIGEDCLLEDVSAEEMHVSILEPSHDSRSDKPSASDLTGAEENSKVSRTCNSL